MSGARKLIGKTWSVERGVPTQELTAWKRSILRKAAPASSGSVMLPGNWRRL